MSNILLCSQKQLIELKRGDAIKHDLVDSAINYVVQKNVPWELHLSREVTLDDGTTGIPDVPLVTFFYEKIIEDKNWYLINP